MADKNDVIFTLAARGQDAFGRSLKSAKSDVEGLGDAGRKAESGLDAAARGTDHLADASDKAGRQLAGVGRRLISTGKIAAVAATAFGGMVVKNGLGFNAAFQSAERSFGTLLGSAKKGNAFMRDLREVSNGTPLKFTSVMDAARVMLGMEMTAGRTKKSLMALNQAVLASGGTEDAFQRAALAIGQLSANGTASKEELNQLAEAGVPVNKILQRELGLTAKQVANIGKEGISSDKVIDAIIRGWTKKYSGAAKAAASDWNNRTAQIGKDWEQLQRVVTKPLFDRLVTHELPVVQKTMKTATTTFAKAYEAGGTMHAFDSMVGSIDATIGAGGRLKNIWVQLKKTGADVKTIVMGGIVPAVTTMTTGVLGLLSPLGLARNALGFLANHTTLVKVAVLTLIPAFVAFRVVLLANLAAKKALAVATVLQETGLRKLVKSTALCTVSQKAWNLATKAGALVATAAKGAVKALTFVMKGLNIAMKANPVMFVVAGLALLTAGVILAWQHSATFRNVVRSVWQWISKLWDKLGPLKTALMAAFGGPVLAAIEAVKLAIEPVKAAVDGIINGLSTVKGWLPGQHGSLNMADFDFAGRMPRGDAVSGGASASIGMRATGGMVQPGEHRTIVGERGPEIVSLPVGSLVSPIQNPRSAGSAASVTIEMPVYLDGREIARSVKRWDNFAGARA